MTGKEKCEVLKLLRREIAEMNGIEFHTTPCNHKGACPGYCQACDAEAKFLMDELRKKESRGEAVRIEVDSLEEFDYLLSEPVDDEDEYDYEDEDSVTLLGNVVPEYLTKEEQLFSEEEIEDWTYTERLRGRVPDYKRPSLWARIMDRLSDWILKH